MSEQRWILAMSIAGTTYECDRCHHLVPALYRRFEQFDLHQFFCVECCGELDAGEGRA